MTQFKEQPLEQLHGINCFTVWMFHGGIILSVPLEEDLLGWGLWWGWGPAYLLFCAAYWSRQPRVFRGLSRSRSKILLFYRLICTQSWGQNEWFQSWPPQIGSIVDGRFQAILKTQSFKISWDLIIRHIRYWNKLLPTYEMLNGNYILGDRSFSCLKLGQGWDLEKCYVTDRNYIFFFW